MRKRSLASALACWCAVACQVSPDTDPPGYVAPPSVGTGSGGSSGTGVVGTGKSVSVTSGAAGSTIGVTGSGGSGAGGGAIAAKLGTYDKAVTIATTPPPPISGGTLTVIDQGLQAAVADSDRDQVVIVDLEKESHFAIALQKGDEPGRIVEGRAGRLHVALRGAGAVATIGVTEGMVLARQPVCSHPRGLAYNATADVVHVACVGGELVTLPAAGGEPTRRLKLDNDLRDIVIDGNRLLVSRFRAAELLVVEADGLVSKRLTPLPFIPSPLTGPPADFSPAVAWRTIAAPGGGALMVLQEEQSSTIDLAKGGGYGGRCGGIVRSTVGVLRADGTGWTSQDLPTALGVDIATSSDGGLTVVAGARSLLTGTAAPIPATAAVVSVTVPSTPTVPPTGLPAAADAGFDAIGPSSPPPCFGGGTARGGPQEGVVAVAIDAKRRVLAQTREPSLWIDGRAIRLPGAPLADTGHELFHLATRAGVACASCHPEGREDGHVWQFSDFGPRRTQSIAGGILGTEPFHWAGDMQTFDVLAHQVFNSRMFGPVLRDDHVQALANWIDRIPSLKAAPAEDPAAVERGRVLFNQPTVGCAVCHAGARFTNNTTVDVGTGAKVQVPSLRGVAFRAPFMHGGCAKTLADRFGTCGGGDAHGITSSLSESQRADLVSYLETL